MRLSQRALRANAGGFIQNTLQGGRQDRTVIPITDYRRLVMRSSSRKESFNDTTKAMRITSLLPVLLTLCTSALTAQNVTNAPWTAYIGSHYTAEPWSGWVRDYSRRLGSYVLDSGEVVGQIDTNLINELFADMSALPLEYDGTLLASGLGRDTQKVNLYMRRIEADNGATWRELCRRQALKLSELPDGKNRIFWQMGNEISSPAYSRLLNLWAENPVPCGGEGCNYDSFVIPLYAEYFFAPSVQGVNEASMQLYGSKDSIPIILGSLTNAGSNVAFQWLDSLMNYTIVGTYAPELAGRKVYELIDIISIHYMMGNVNSDSWRAQIDRYRDAWFGKGKVKGIWSTEEVGINAAQNGRGAARGAATTARYLEWAILNNYSPYQCRTNYYAHGTGPAGSTVDDLNQTTLDFLGHVPLSLVDQALLAHDTPDVEVHAFLTPDTTKGIIYTMLKTAPPQPGSVSSIRITGQAMGNITHATTHYFSPSGHQVIAPTITSTHDTLLLDLNTAFALDSGEAVLVTLIETRSSTSSAVQEAGLPGSSVSINPNPSSDGRIRISSANRLERIRLLNSAGESVLTEEMGGRYTVEIDGNFLAKGIYLVELKLEDDTIINKKIILQ